MRRRGPNGPSARSEERRQLKARWENNRRHKDDSASSPNEACKATAISTTYTFDADGNQVIIQRRGERAMATITATDKRFAELREKVESWNRRPGKNGDKVADVKDISGEDVSEILALAYALTNHPAYEEARKAMILHRLRGGLRQSFKDLQKRHGHHLQQSAISACVVRNVDGYSFIDEIVELHKEDIAAEKPRPLLGHPKARELRRAAVEYLVANLGIPGTSFENAVEMVRKADEMREQLEAQEQQYLEELHGLRDPRQEKI